MRLHYLPGTAAMAPHATLAEIGAPYQLVRVERDGDGRVSEEYLALNPWGCLLYTSPSPRDISGSRMPSSA